MDTVHTETDDQNLKYDDDSPVKEEVFASSREECKLELQCLQNDDEVTHDRADVRENNTDISIKRIWFNLIIYSFSFLLLFSAFLSFSNLQSTVNQVEGLGTVGISVIYLTMIMTSLFLPPFIMSKFTLKWISVVSMVMYLGYLATGYYSSWTTVIPASVVIGLGAAHLWTANPAYLVQLAKMYAAKTKKDSTKIIGHFNGVFFLMFCSTHFWGNLYSSLVLHADKSNSSHVVDDDRKCGAEFCSYEETNSTAIDKPATDQMYTYTSICMALGVAAALFIALFIRNDPPDRNQVTIPLSHRFREVLTHLVTNRRQQLLIFTSIYRGVTQGFIVGDFTVAFVSCPLGVENVGFVMMAYGLTSAVCSYMFGKASTYTGLYPLFCLAFLVHTGVCITMLLWQPDASQSSIIYLLAALWSVGDSIYLSIVTVIYSIYLKKNQEAALSCFRVLDSLGMGLTFGYSAFLCTRYKIYIVQTFHLLSQISITVFFVIVSKSKCLT